MKAKGEEAEEDGVRVRSLSTLCSFVLRIVECQRHCLSCWPSRVESQHDLFLPFRMLLSPQFQQQRCHLREHHLRTLHLGMATRTQRDHQFQPGEARDAMMHRDLTFPSTRSAAPSAAVAVAREDRFAQAAEVRFVLPLHRVATRAQSQRKYLRMPARAAKRVLGTSLP